MFFDFLVIPLDKTVEKVWVNGPKPSVTIELWRKNNVEGADKIDEKVDEFVVPANASGDALKKTFTKLAKHDSKGNEFEYYVKEENVPANYTKKIEGLKVTNSYTQPTDGEVEVTMNVPVLGAGVGLVTTGIVLSKRAEKKAIKVVDIYNARLKTTSFWNTHSLDLSFCPNGIGVSCMAICSNWLA